MENTQEQVPSVKLTPGGVDPRAIQHILETEMERFKNLHRFTFEMADTPTNCRVLTHTGEAINSVSSASIEYSADFDLPVLVLKLMNPIVVQKNGATTSPAANTP